VDVDNGLADSARLKPAVCDGYASCFEAAIADDTALQVMKRSHGFMNTIAEAITPVVWGDAPFDRRRTEEGYRLGLDLWAELFQ
jgi:hypothetical protein